jgi:hypothetical protein
VIPALRRWGRITSFEVSIGYIVRPSLKNKKNCAGVMAQVVENLPNKNEALSSNSSTTKKTKKLW